MKLSIVIAIALSLTGMSWANAQEQAGESKVRLEDSKPTTTQDEITNAKIKAMSGSQSRYSFSADLTYEGASIKDPTASKLPNPDKNIVEPLTSLSGNVGLSYRINERTTMGAGTGMAFLAPFEGLNQSEISTPFAKYAYSFEAFGVEQISKFTLDYFTGRNRKSGRDMALHFSQYGAMPIGESRWSLGMEVGAVAKTFTNFQEGDYDYGWGATPFVEYLINDTLTFTTSVTVGGTHYSFNDGFWDLESDTIYGDLGLNVAVTDLINISPTIVYYLEDPKADTTTVSVSGIINLE